MKSFIAKLWQKDVMVFRIMLLIATIIGNVLSIYATFNSGDLLGIYSVATLISNPFAMIALCFFSLLIVFVFYNLFISLYYMIFVKIYVKSYGGSLIQVNELPLSKNEFFKFISLFMSIALIFMGLVRILPLFVPLSTNIIESIVIPLIKLIVAILSFVTMKKYLLFGRVAFNTLVALGIPFIVIFVLF